MKGIAFFFFFQKHKHLKVDVCAKLLHNFSCFLLRTDYHFECVCVIQIVIARDKVRL